MGVRSARLGAPNLVVASTAGASAALIVAGPARGRAVWGRVLGTGVAGVFALLVGRLRHRARWMRGLDVALLLAGVAALVLVADQVPAWTGALDADGLRQGAVLGQAIAALVAVGGRATTAMRLRRA